MALRATLRHESQIPEEQNQVLRLAALAPDEQNVGEAGL